MRRLIWKELRENFWMMGVTLAVPFILLLWSYYTSTENPWRGFPRYPSDLILANIAFAIWGALQSSSKQKNSIQFLPFHSWNTTAIKLALGIAWAWVCALLAHSVEVYSFAQTNCFVSATGMTLSYLVALLIGMLWGVGFSGTIGAFVGFLWNFLPLLNTDESHSYHSHTMLSISWLCLTLVIFAIVITCLKARAYNTKYLRIAVSIYALLVIIVVCYESRNDTADGVVLGPLTACESHILGKVAYVTVENSQYVVAGGRMCSRSINELNIADIDGRNSQTIVQGYWAYPLLWTNNGELIYTVSTGSRTSTRLCAWSAHTKRTRVIADLPIISIYNDYGISNTINTIDAKGKYLFVPCSRSKIAMQTTRNDLWIVDLDTGDKHLAYPDINLRENIQPLLLNGMLYLKQNDKWFEISPEGGLPHQIHILPEERKDKQI